MLTKAILIGLLVIGGVVVLETDVRAGCVPCGAGWTCCWLPTDMNELLEEVKKYENSQVWLIRDTYNPPSGKELDVREMLIQRGLPPEIIGELILEGRTPLISTQKGEGRTPLMSTQKGQLVTVTRPK